MCSWFNYVYISGTPQPPLIFMLNCGQLLWISFRGDINCAILMCESPRLGMSLNFLCIWSMKLWFTQRGISAIHYKEIIKKCQKPARSLIGRSVRAIRKEKFTRAGQIHVTHGVQAILPEAVSYLHSQNRIWVTWMWRCGIQTRRKQR